SATCPLSLHDALPIYDQRQRDGEHTRALEVVREGRIGRLRRARIAELTVEETGMGVLRIVDALEYGAELVAGVLLFASDLELDRSEERRVGKEWRSSR